MAKPSSLWHKFAKNPVIRPHAETWNRDGIMTADILKMGETFFFYYVGKGEGKDYIGVTTVEAARFDGITWNEYQENPVLCPGPPGSFDSRMLVDPASVIIDGEVRLYYSALGDGPDMIGMAFSKDGKRFTKYSKPILKGRAPEVVFHNSLLNLFYVDDSPGGGYEIHIATSRDGITFKREGPVFKPSVSGWDSLSVTTPRIYLDQGIYILTYAGDDKVKDYPWRFGHAFSRDLRQWVRYPKNPVLERGAADEWDSKAIWFGEVLRYGGNYYMWYEGTNGQLPQIGMAVCEESLVTIGAMLINKSISKPR
jgi:predicted GH43/DUF377 family glycosyl hydrolase